MRRKLLCLRASCLEAEGVRVLEGNETGRAEAERSKYEGDLVVRRPYREKWLPEVLVYPRVVLGAGDLSAMGQYT